jgi:hypothetical protein
LGTDRARSTYGEAAASPAGRRRLIFIVSREAEVHHEYLQRAFAGEPDVEVILDRRRADRRRRTEPTTWEYRRRERRIRPNAEERLRAVGWSIVEVHPVP